MEDTNYKFLVVTVGETQPTLHACTTGCLPTCILAVLRENFAEFVARSYQGRIMCEEIEIGVTRSRGSPEMSAYYGGATLICNRIK